ncbi:NAD/NADP-dependent betaine aldehyde dehydrogenase [Nitratireductor aestuarii]|uniref:NAD/NADP-dependent betaine aldehyde dehydrogenase n=1 Tax=Nitratireductor aestuarii TaxID=1735103 RepID=A0A916S118_9HYPH|nr:aldehyde dehydrogenase family protein [Nitratireductor aestuarii]GGA79792.1 NAD/NADP-dependent betaine aldehyde dehydrogenase [Nitratireductor aestuarii]
MYEAKLLINGELVEAASGARFERRSPSDLSLIGSAAAAGPEDVKRAVDAAVAAQPAWAALSLDARIGYMRKVANAIRARREEIARLESLDSGNIYGPMLGDVDRAASRIEYYSGLAHGVLGATYPATADHLHISVREPFGVVARIIAFNHPFYFAASRFTAPLVTGNAVIVKSPEQAPLTGGILAEICSEILPAGVVSILSGDGPNTGQPLVTDRRVKRIGFIGSVPTAMRIQASTAPVGIKAITHELGGKNMMVVLPDADLDKAAALALEGMNFQWQGQSCGSTSCLMIHDDVYDELLEKVVAKVSAIKVGHPLEPGCGMGPLVSEEHYNKVTGLIAKAKESGTRILAGGKRPEGAQFEKGYWVEPTVFEVDRRDHMLMKTEVFGPVLTVMRWKDASEIIEVDDASDLGLTASIVGKDIDQALAFARRLNVGYVWINCVGPHYVGVPYGGMKNSGVGREEGIEELLSYTEVKSINIAVPRLA